MRLGIDFGTTRTVVAQADRGNYPVVAFTDEEGDAHEFIPSVVAEHEGELVFGWKAVAHGEAVRSFKRLLADGRGTVRVGSTTLPVEELVGRFLEHVRDAIIDAEGNLGDVRSVVAVPANASGLQRFVTLDAFRRAGLGPVAMLNEPSAAGFEYTHRHRDTLTSKRDHVVVYDLGGGTFDASLVRMRGRQHEVLATAGKNKLGGDDFDDVLLDLVLDKAGVRKSALDAQALDRLRTQCRDAKERLGPSSRKIAIDVEGSVEGHGDVSVPVTEFYEACKPLVEASIETMVPVMTRLEDATKDDVEKALGEIAGIYVVGGASELPIVARALRERFGRRVHRSPYPSAAIAIGLAIACDESAGFELADRFSRTFGVFREARAGADVTFDPIFTQATSLPARFRRQYRAAHNVGHFRFLECSATTDDGRPRGDMMLSGDVLFPFDRGLQRSSPTGGVDLAAVPVVRLDGSGPLVEEEYTLDENGIVGVTIKDLDAGFVREFRLGG